MFIPTKYTATLLYFVYVSGAGACYPKVEGQTLGLLLTRLQQPRDHKPCNERVTLRKSRGRGRGR